MKERLVRVLRETQTLKEFVEYVGVLSFEFPSSALLMERREKTLSMSGLTLFLFTLDHHAIAQNRVVILVCKEHSSRKK